MTLVAFAAVLLSVAAPQDFARDIAPIFAARCLPCHGPEKQRSGYRLDNREVALRGGELSAPNLVPGKASESPLLHYVTAAADDDMRMPPRATACRLTKSRASARGSTRAHRGRRRRTRRSRMHATGGA